MTQETIFTGTTGNDGTGDKLRDAFTKVNNNFDELYNTANVALANTSNVTFAGNLYFPNTALIGIGTNSPQAELSVVANGASQIALAGAVIDGTGNTDFTIQLNIRNNNPGTNASSDIVATNDTGADYIDLGINSSHYNNDQWTITSPGDGYLFNSNNSLAIGTLSNTGSIKFFTGGQLIQNQVAKIDTHGLSLPTMSGPYSNDSIAASHGVPLKTFYYDGSGVVRIRLV
jgi:hypothetical protein